MKKQGKTIQRLFRDKEELPITSNLSDDIYRALKNSDFLIVICSVHTKESVWVQREIETFLQTHDISRVLTVLVNGEPYETIPEILLSREVADPVTGQVCKEVLEPLSCDWRMSRRKAMREELPRLAAALLSCQYDELRQRERQYRTQRLIVALSLGLCGCAALAGYYIYSSIQIQKNLDNALINQSQYLSAAAAQELNAGDRMLAVSLALEALPGTGTDRPYVAQAEYALGQALGIYATSSDLQTVGAVACGGNVTRFDVAEDQGVLYTCDQQKMLSAWDLESYRLLASFSLENSEKALFVNSEGNALVLDYDGVLRCINPRGELIWQQEGIGDAALSRDGNMVVCLRDMRLTFFSCSAGEEILPSLPVSFSDGSVRTEDMLLHLMQDSYDLGNPLLIVGTKTGGSSYVISVDPSGAGSRFLLETGEEYAVLKTETTENGLLLISTVETKYQYNLRFGTMNTNSPVENRLWCFRADGAAPLWVAEITTYGDYSSQCTIKSPDPGHIVWQVDTAISRLDAATGALTESCDTGAAIVWIDVGPDSAIAVQDNGAVGLYDYADNAYRSVRYFEGGLSGACMGKYSYASRAESAQVLIYAPMPDENWEPIPGGPDYFMGDVVCRGDLVAALDNRDLYLMNVRTKELLWKFTAEKEGDEMQDITSVLGFSEDGSYLFVYDSLNAVCRVDTATGQISRFALPQSFQGRKLFYEDTGSSPLSDGDKVYLTAHTASGLEDEGLWCIVVWNPTTRESALLPVCPLGKETDGKERSLLTVRDDRLYAWEEGTAAIYEIDLINGAVTLFHEQAETRPVMQIQEKPGWYSLCIGESVFLCGPQDEKISIALNGDRGVSCCLFGDELLVLTDKADLLVLDAATGEEKTRLPVHAYGTYTSDIDFNHSPEKLRFVPVDEHTLFLSCFRAGNLINTDEWCVTAFIPNCLSYCQATDSFVTLDASNEDRGLGIVHRYTREALYQAARHALGSYQMTVEQKVAYGLS